MEVRPVDLRAVARVLTRDANGLQEHLRRMRLAADAVALHNADPELDANLTARQARALAGIRRSVRALSAVAEEVESAAADALAADRVDGGWTSLGAGDHQALICRLPDDLRSVIDRRLTDAVGDGLSALATAAVRVAAQAVPAGGRNVSGDPGGSFSSRRVPLAGPSLDHADTPPLSPAARLVAAALDATADQTVLAHDEFGLVVHGRDRYTVVLPGVTDLSRPEPGWNPVHRSARDLDMAAFRSSRSASVADNTYAATVADALVEVGVPDGAEFLIVGHSFGADTALDLAADPSFSTRYAVTHVVATGHFSQPRLPSVPVETRVLVVQNRHDIVVHLSSGMPTTETGVLDCPPAGSVVGPNTSVVRFDGGLGGLGHSVDVYRSVFTAGDDLGSMDAAVVGDFLDSIGQTSDPPQAMLAVDISLPRHIPAPTTTADT
ncbi:MAG: hypothetical protein OES24_04615 [Acidimicrobiia bacterium]|nr:hypothetical protein [Acidimicrobiia bacterium]